jgi:AcrR family transcriptional regulator
VGSAERRQRENVETRQRIMDAARDLFVLKGYEATSMRAIAQRIEYTPTAIYHHFASKEALLTELVNRDFMSLAAAFQRIGRVEDPVERLQRIGQTYVDFALEHPMHYQFMFMTVRPAAVRKPDIAMGDPVEDAYAFLRTTVQEAIDQDRFLPEYRNADQVAQMLWGSLHGLISLHIAKEHDAWVDFGDLRATTIEASGTMLRGLSR